MQRKKLNMQTFMEDRDPTPNLLLRIVFKEGVLTGSKALGGYDPENSDIDYILPPNFNMFLFDGRFVKWRIGSADLFQSAYIKSRSGRVYNLLIMKTYKEFWSWVMTTKVLVLLVKEFADIGLQLFRDKKTRVAIFESLKISISDNYPESTAITDSDIPF